MKTIFSRDNYLEKIEKFIDRPFIKVLTGIRRCGKSTLLRLLTTRLLERGVLLENILCINKESVDFDDIVDYRTLAQYVKTFFQNKTGPTYLFIDEIQEIDIWEKAVASIFAEGRHDIVITGSNAHLLSSELATRLSGRYVEIPVFPLSFREFLKFRGADHDPAALETNFELFLRYGGMPAIHGLDLEDESVFQYLSGLFNTIFLRDIIARHAIRDVATIELVARFLFDNCGNITTAKRIADYMKNQRLNISSTTVQNYLSYFSQGYLVHRARRFEVKGLKHLEFYDKYFMGDIGLRHGFIGYREKDISGILENIVYLELRLRGYVVSIGRIDDREIDFVAQKQKQTVYVQVAYLMVDNDTIEREFGALERIKDNYPKIVLSLDRHFSEERGGIRWQNLIEFLAHDTTI